MQTGILIPEKLIPEAEAFLIVSKVALPTLYYLKREINSFCSKHQEKIFAGIYQQLSEALINVIDDMLEMKTSRGFKNLRNILVSVTPYMDPAGIARDKFQS